MGSRITNRDAERLIARDPAPEQEPVAALIDDLLAIGDGRVAASTLDRLAQVAALAAMETEPANSAVPVRSLGTLTLRRRVVAGLTSAVLTLGSFGGVAVAANDARPGDLLYRVDRIAENVGIGSGGSEERIEEAGELVEDGEVARGLEHLADTVTEDEGRASEALTAAAERVTTAGTETSAETRALVADLLTYLAEPGDGTVDGEKVAELARAIGGPPVEPGPPEITPSDTAPGPPDDVPGPGNRPDRP